MSLVEDEECMEEDDLDLTTPTTNDMEIETKIKIEEVTINLGSVKKELDDEIDSGGSSGINRSKIGGNFNFSTDVDKIKIENVKIKKFHCNNCNGKYIGYCIYCSSLSHILNNITDVNSESEFTNIPGNILEIRDAFKRKAVIALRTIPKDVIFGPYHGTFPIESTNGCRWKIKDWKFVNHENANWMRNVCGTNQFSKNLSIFQNDKNLYFQTSREIKAGEELLVWYNEEVTQKLENGEECYFVPVEKEKLSKIFACTLCCLGFRLERCLVQHKSKCPHAQYNGDVEDLEIVECRSCKVWLEKQEHLETHMLYCLEHCNRMCITDSNYEWINSDDGDEALRDVEPPTLNEVDRSPVDTIENSTGTEKERPEKECPENSHEIGDDKNFNPPVSKKGCKGKRRGKRKCVESVDDPKTHINVDHSYAKSMLHESPETSRTYVRSCNSLIFYRANADEEISSNNPSKAPNGDVTKSPDKTAKLTEANNTYECDFCTKIFHQKKAVIDHLSRIHTIPRSYHRCSKCVYATNSAAVMREHFNTHSDVKSFQCNLCKKVFSHEQSLGFHKQNHLCYIQSNHTDTKEKPHKCPYCPYRATHRSHLSNHLNLHIDDTKLKCDICKSVFKKKYVLRLHIYQKHIKGG